MGARLKGDKDSQIIQRFTKWVVNTRAALRDGQTLPACSEFVLTCFVKKLCSIHRHRTLSEETGETIVCNNHHYLYNALRLTYDFRLKFKTNISILLREIFLCEGSLQAIFSILILQHQHRPSNVSINTYTLYTRLHPFDRSAFKFYVKCICPLGRDVRERGGIVYTPEIILNREIHPEAPTPLLAATRLGDLELVLLLLRHGADPLVRYRGDDMEFPLKSAVGFAIDRLNMLTLLTDSWIVSYPAGEIDKALHCVTYFSRAVPALDIRESGRRVYTTHRPDDTLKGGHFEVQHRVTKLLDLTSFSRPPSLRHACRCVIREAVRCAGKETIPQALKQLQLPCLVRKFLDLQC